MWRGAAALIIVLVVGGSGLPASVDAADPDMSFAVLSPPGPGFAQVVEDPTAGREPVDPPCEPADLPSVQLVHAVPAGESGSPDAEERWRTNARWMNGDVVRGAERAGGGDRQIRFVTGSDCTVEVLRIEFSAAPGALNAVLAIRSELARLGHSRRDRVYLAWADGHPDGGQNICGVANRREDDRPAARNDDYGDRVMYGVLLDECADQTTSPGPLHELFHMLGAVQESAPNFTLNGHVTDGSDLMSANDRPGSVCPDPRDVFTPDCGHDDYFHPSPPPGSYLATHWNVADSPLLSDLPPGGAPPTEPPAPPAEPPAPPTDPPTPPVPDVQRFGQEDPAARAVAVAAARFPDGEDPPARVLLARDDEFADSLTASSLMADGALLYTTREALPSVTEQGIRRLLDLARAAGRDGLTVTVLGGTAAITDEVEQQVRAIDPALSTIRLEGPSRVETAIAIADHLEDVPGAVAIARAGGTAAIPSAGWADSIAAGAFVAGERMPLLLTPTDSLHPAVEAWLATHDVDVTYVLGGIAAIADPVAARLPGEVRRLAGDSRDGTAAAVNRAWPARTIDLAIAFNGYAADGWQDGLLAAGLAVDGAATVLLVDRDAVPPATASLAEEGCAALVLVATASRVSEEVSDALGCST